VIPFASLIGGIWAKVAAVAGVILAIITFGALKKREGKLELQADEAKKLSQAQTRKRERDRAVDAVSDDDLTLRMRSTDRTIRERILRSIRAGPARGADDKLAGDKRQNGGGKRTKKP
jgi:hypothetical protein